MEHLARYMKDGACAQARAVLAFLQDHEGIESSWNAERRWYDAEVKVARWENCREQGYIVSVYHMPSHRQLNIAFFEHRNSDCICALRWEQWSINTITIEHAKFENGYRDDKYNVDHQTKFGEVAQMAEWIHDEFEKFWIECGTNVEVEQ